MRFSSKQVVTMVACVCATIVLAPVGVMAAAGQIVNIADPILDRKVRVGSGGTLQVESRAGALSGAFNKTFTVTSLGVFKIAEVTGPSRIALTEVTLSGRDVDFDAEVYLQTWTQTTGTAACSTQSTGWVKEELRRFSFPMYETTQVTFDGPPLVIPAAPAGKKQCVAFVVHARGTESRIFLGATGYTYS